MQMMSLGSPAFRSPTSDPLGLWPLEMLGGYPALIVRLCAASNRGSICTNNRCLIGWIYLLAATRRALSSFSSLTAAALLREECCDPGAVDKVACAAKCCCKEEVEEETVMRSQRVSS